MRYYFFLLSLVFLGCQKEESGPLPQKTTLNAAYGTDAAQVMDVYLPAGRSKDTTKVMILIHGGAWSTGDKADFTQYVDTLKNRIPGYAIINLNYRLSTGTTYSFPAQENDVKAAMDFIYSKRSEYDISDKFVILGGSAGGHLALLQGLKYNSPVKVKAIVDFFGPTDMADLYNNPASILIPPATIALIVGATPASNPMLYQQSSPINFVTAQSPPVIIFHGGVDPLVNPSQSVALDAKLQAMGVIHEYYFYPTEGHGWTGANLKHSFDKIGLFLAAYVN
jgi:acetyl esterase/lipase